MSGEVMGHGYNTCRFRVLSCIFLVRELIFLSFFLSPFLSLSFSLSLSLSLFIEGKILATMIQKSKSWHFIRYRRPQTLCPYLGKFAVAIVWRLTSNYIFLIERDRNDAWSDIYTLPCANVNIWFHHFRPTSSYEGCINTHTNSIDKRPILIGFSILTYSMSLELKQLFN